jgi:hypothetical protein
MYSSDSVSFARSRKALTICCTLQGEAERLQYVAHISKQRLRRTTYFVDSLWRKASSYCASGTCFSFECWASSTVSGLEADSAQELRL